MSDKENDIHFLAYIAKKSYVKQRDTLKKDTKPITKVYQCIHSRKERLLVLIQ